MDSLQTLWDAVFESGVDRLLFGGAARFVLPHAQRYLIGAWRRCRPTVAAKYEVAKTAPLWRKAVAPPMLAWVAGGIPIYALTGGMDGNAPLWALCWAGSIIASAILGCAARECWLMGRWVVRR